MKKILLFILILGMTFSVCACSKESDNVTDKTVNEKTNNSDLTMTRMLGSFDDVWADFPEWREDGSETCTVVSYYNYYIIAVISDEDYDFTELFNNVAKSDLRHFVDRGTYEDFNPESKEEVTLSNKLKATKFSGVLHLEDYGDLYDYKTYGYYFKFNNYPVMIMAIETDVDSVNNSEEQRNITNKYVDKIVETIRSSK